MWIPVIFLLGIANFALHRAVLESRHPMVEGLLAGRRKERERLLLAMEFAILLAALLLAVGGHAMWSWAYLGYSGANALSGWLILTRRI